MKRKLVYLFLFSFCFFACSKDPIWTNSDKDINNIPIGFPEMVYPADNPFSETSWQLGKRLFYDTRLSKDSSVSCASCHIAEYGFSDTIALSLGFQKTKGVRNSLPLFNVGYHPYFTREGGVPTLEMQVLVPIQEAHEFNFNILEIVNRLKFDSVYQELSEKAYSRSFDHFVITRAIANFERSLISGNSRYDQYSNQGLQNSLSEEQIEGMNLFFSEKTNCSKCHSGFNFTNYSFENNGLYEVYEDLGRKRLTGDEQDLALFKVPSLRNVGVSAPYMHDGSIKTLEEVIDHYSSGGEAHPSKSEHIKALNLTQKEKDALISFLHSLTDYSFLNNPIYKE